MRLPRFLKRSSQGSSNSLNSSSSNNNGNGGGSSSSSSFLALHNASINSNPSNTNHIEQVLAAISTTDSDPSTAVHQSSSSSTPTTPSLSRQSRPTPLTIPLVQATPSDLPVMVETISGATERRSQAVVVMSAASGATDLGAVIPLTSATTKSGHVIPAQALLSVGSNGQSCPPSPNSETGSIDGKSNLKRKHATSATSAVPAVPGQKVHILDLPGELLIAIALSAGFHSATTFMKTCTRLEALLSNPAAWHDYTRTGSSDLIETEVTICTKIHTFDHLVFGLWSQDPEMEATASSKASPPSPRSPTSPSRLRANSVSSPSKGTPNNILRRTTSEPSIYFEHLTFSEQYDFLGGVSLSMAPGGLTSSEFFDHKESLPCYQRALRNAVAVGALPPSAPHGDPPAGSRIDHTCEECVRFDSRRVLKSIFVFDQVPYHPRWGREGFSWHYDYPDKRRRLKIRIKPFQGVLGYCSVRDLPSVFVNCVSVNGKPLKGDEYDLFQRLVNGRSKPPPVIS